MDECLIWEKSTMSSGYGQTFVDGKLQAAHRVAWQAIYGEIPAGMFLDHLCHNEAVKNGTCSGGNCEHHKCYNPNHLALVTPQANVMSGAHNVDNRGVFKCGHSVNERNTMVRKNGDRECAECNRVRSRAAYARKKLVSA